MADLSVHALSELTCAFCGDAAEGNHTIERDGMFHGPPEVDLCDACGAGERPTLREILGRIGQAENCLACEEEILAGDARSGSFHAWCFADEASRVDIPTPRRKDTTSGTADTSLPCGRFARQQRFAGGRAMGEKRAFSAWIEQLGANGEVIRVRCAPAGKYLARVVPHGGRSWRVERREPGAWLRSEADKTEGMAPVDRAVCVRIVADEIERAEATR